MVDDIEAEVRTMEERVRRVEDEVLVRPARGTLTEIFTNRRNLLLRKMIRPQRDAIGLLVEGGHPLIHPSVGLYLRDVFDHTERTLDTIDTQLDITGGSLDIYLSSMSNRMNDVMRMLTMISTVIMPLTLIVGLYTITSPAPYPEWELGPVVTILVMILIVASMIVLFRKRRWL
ncbi:MAG: CorA family divalent cation transporter [Candidatus Bathyarchaeia archaeon]